MFEFVMALALWCGTSTGTAERSVRDIQNCRDRILECAKKIKTIGEPTIAEHEKCFFKERLTKRRGKKEGEK